MDSDSESEEPREAFTARGSVGRVLLINARDPQCLGTPAQALAAARAAVRRELRAGAGAARFTAVCLYNTGGGVRGVVEILPLAAPSLSDYRKLLAADATSHGDASASELADALWHCGRTFAASTRSLSERTVLLLTRLDDPPPQLQRRPALKRAVDLANLGITLQIVNVSREIYSPDPFYEELLRASKGGGESIIPELVWDVKDIESQLCRRSHRLSAFSRLRLSLGEGPGIAVAIYHLTRKQGPPRKVNISKDRSEIISSNITTLKVTTQPADIEHPGPSNRDVQMQSSAEVPLLKSELLYYQVYGDKKIEFTPEELANMKNAFGPPAIKLLGFKPQHILAKEKWFLKSCHFLFPDESSVEGSTRAFRALHRACTEQNVVAICMVCPRVNSRPRVVALMPCERPLGLQIDIGFDIILIPYLENLKDIPETEEDIPMDTPAEIDLMKDIVQCLQFKYTPDKFENPVLQSLYCAIEALALEEESTEPFVDTTKPEESAFQNINSEFFEDIFGPFGGAVKRPWADNTNVNIDEGLLQSRINMKQVHKYTVNDLKNILSWKNLPDITAMTGLKKAELVQLVYNHCS